METLSYMMMEIILVVGTEMNELEYNLQFEKLCNVLQLGELTDIPEAVPGGLLHRMYAVKTTEGKYAIKALNPQIMLRPTAMQNFINSERVVNIVANKLPALPAKKFDGTFLQKIDNQYYIVFDWIEGKCLKNNEINIDHCKKIGAILADIHMTDFSMLEIVNDLSNNIELTDWNFYLQKGQENNSVWANLLLKIIDKLYEWNAQGIKSGRMLSTDMVISHGDLDPKNVIWNLDNPTVIDWEAAGYVNPMQELAETAICWSENDLGEIDKDRFLAFIDGYKSRWGKIQANWSLVLINGFLGKLGWLKYNLERSLGIECTDEKEQQIGTAQVIGTINGIKRYASMITELEEWVQDI